MRKKSLILVSVILFVLCVFSNVVSANNDVKNGISNVTNTVVNGVENLGKDVRSGIGAAENGIEGALRMDGNQTSTNNADNTATNARSNTNNGYTATRTATNALTNNDTSTLWIWLVVAIAAIVIIGLVWYYGTQNNTHHNE